MVCIGWPLPVMSYSTTPSSGCWAAAVTSGAANSTAAMQLIDRMRSSWPWMCSTERPLRYRADRGRAGAQGGVEPLRDRAGLAAADGTPIDAHNRHHVRGGARHEHLLGVGQIVRRPRAPDDRHAELLRLLDQALARDAGEAVVVRRVRAQGAAQHGAQIGAGAFGDASVGDEPRVECYLRDGRRFSEHYGGQLCRSNV